MSGGRRGSRVVYRRRRVFESLKGVKGKTLRVRKGLRSHSLNGLPGQSWVPLHKVGERNRLLRLERLKSWETIKDNGKKKVQTFSQCAEQTSCIVQYSQTRCKGSILRVPIRKQPERPGAVQCNQLHYRPRCSASGPSGGARHFFFTQKYCFCNNFFFFLHLWYSWALRHLFYNVDFLLRVFEHSGTLNVFVAQPYFPTDKYPWCPTALQKQTY